MSKITMDQYTLQSYFQSVCKSFYIAYMQVKRLREEDKKLEEKYPEEELEVVNVLLDNVIPETLRKEIGLCSTEELEKKKKEYEKLKEEYMQKSKDLEEPRRFWNNEFWQKSYKQVESIISEIKKQEFSIIVTSKEEVIVLMAFLKKANLEDNEIINVSEECLPSFPTGQMCEEFLKAYISKDDDEMKKVIKKYY